MALRDTILDIQRFTRFIVSRHATHVDSVPSYLTLLELPSGHTVRRIVAGGEACPPALANKLGSHVDFFNAYGPTETTVTALTGGLNIGKPLNNIHAYIWDQYGKMVPTGVSGELTIGGAGVARGYLNRPELTHEYFGPDPLISKGRVYRSGDICRLNPAGEVEFIGRKDSQIKIRGNRVEPLEVRHIIMEHDAVKDAVVICRSDNSGAAILVAYLVYAAKSFDMNLIHQHLKRNLPSYMIPSHLIPLEAIPLNTSGKLDLERLPEPEFEGESQVKLPANQTEERLLDIWSDVLELERSSISIDADFFSLGGHSLKATALVSRIRSQLKTDVPLGEIFKTPTVTDIATYIEDRLGLGNLASSQQLVPLKLNADQLPSLFFIHDGLGQVSGYRDLCEHLNHDFNYWGIQTSMDTIASLDESILQKLTDEHVDTIRTIQTDGPYFIAGWSMGGAIAFSVSKRLEMSGCEIRFLGLIDADIPINILQRKKLKGNICTFNAGKENLYDLDTWRLYCGGDFKSHYITGDHHSILTAPDVLELAMKFKKAMKITQRSHHNGK
jgi:thioesterase domain-containing protein/acyl carrier protein